MKDFFASVYEVFRSFFGENLASFLYGLCGNNTGDLYTQAGITLFIISLLSCFLFYRVVGNSQWYKVKHWLIFMFGGAVLTGVITALMPLTKKNAGIVCSQFTFSTQDAIFFGVVNFIICIAAFFLHSLWMRFIAKKAVRYTPF